MNKDIPITIIEKENLSDIKNHLLDYLYSYGNIYDYDEWESDTLGIHPNFVLLDIDEGYIVITYDFLMKFLIQKQMFIVSN